MSVKSETAVRWWNAAATACFGLAVLLPAEFLPQTNPPRDALGYLVAGAFGLIVAGYWLRMLVECLLDRAVPRRWLWVALILFFPPCGAFIYFASTRSLRGQKAMAV